MTKKKMFFYDSFDEAIKRHNLTDVEETLLKLSHVVELNEIVIFIDVYNLLRLNKEAWNAD